MNLIGLEIGSSLFVYFWPFRGFFFQVQTQNCHRTSYLGPTDTFRGLLCKSVSMTSSGQGLSIEFMPVRRSVSQSIRRSIGWSVGPSVRRSVKL